MKNIVQRIKDIAMNILVVFTVLLLIATIFFLIVGDKENGFLGYRPFIIISDSMNPTYPKYTFLVIKEADVNTVKEGEGIAFRSSMVGGDMVFHRAMEVTPFGVITKGDANKVRDSEIVNSVNFLGREFFHISLFGKIYQDPVKYAIFGGIIIIVIALLIIVYKNRGVFRKGPKDIHSDGEDVII